MTPLIETYNAFKKRLQKVCKENGRDSEEITLIAVSKNSSLKEIDCLHEEGQQDFGENRIPSSLVKVMERPQLHWHYIGPLQSNKVKKAVEHFSWIHSVDSYPLAQKIEFFSQKMEIPPSILFQINCSSEKNKHGFTPKEFSSYLPELAKLKNLKVKGLMTMAPFTVDKSAVRACFSSCSSLLKELCYYFPEAHHLSMGMSNDWEVAIEEGATLLRIGSGLFAPHKKE